MSDEDSADEIDEDCKLLDGDVSGAGGWGGRGAAAGGVTVADAQAAS